MPAKCKTVRVVVELATYRRNVRVGKWLNEQVPGSLMSSHVMTKACDVCAIETYGLSVRLKNDMHPRLRAQSLGSSIVLRRTFLRVGMGSLVG